MLFALLLSCCHAEPAAVASHSVSLQQWHADLQHIRLAAMHTEAAPAADSQLVIGQLGQNRRQWAQPVIDQLQLLRQLWRHLLLLLAAALLSGCLLGFADEQLGREHHADPFWLEIKLAVRRRHG